MAVASANAAALTAKISALETRIEKLQRSLNQRASMTAVIGVLIVLLLCGYFFWAYTQITALLEPQTLVFYAKDMLESNMGSVREELESQILQNSPQWAEDASAQIVESMPKAREYLEEFIESQADGTIASMTGLTAKEFEKFVKDNHTYLEDGFKNLQGGSEQSEQFIASLIPLFEKELGGSIQDSADQLLVTVQDLNHKVELMNVGEDLDDVMRTGRDILMICRLIHPPDPAVRAKLIEKVSKAPPIRVRESAPTKAASKDAAKPADAPKATETPKEDAKKAEPAKDEAKKE